MYRYDDLLRLGRRFRAQLLPVESSPPTPPQGYVTVYMDPLTSAMKTKDSAGAVASVGSGGGAPSGAAGGDLGGTYPDPTVTRARGLRETSGPTTLTIGAMGDGEVAIRSGATLVTLAAPAAADRQGRVLGYSGTTLAWVAMPLIGVLGRGEIVVQGRGIADVPNCVTVEVL